MHSCITKRVPGFERGHLLLPVAVSDNFVTLDRERDFTSRNLIAQVASTSERVAEIEQFPI